MTRSVSEESKDIHDKGNPTNWSCPFIDHQSSEGINKFSCICPLKHALRCDGEVSYRKKSILKSIINHVKMANRSDHISLLDISIQNLQIPPGRLFVSNRKRKNSTRVDLDLSI